MNRRRGILGGLIGFLFGLVGGAFLGLLVGGTFLGGLDIHLHTGLQNYELGAYIGAVIGIIVATPFGFKLSQKPAV